MKAQETKMKRPSINNLRDECQRRGLPIGGSKKELAERLAVAEGGVANRYVGGGIALKCQICNLRAKVTKTASRDLGDGRTLITRQVKCIGRHGHTYPIREIVKPD